MPTQLPVNFEFRANQTFDDFYAGRNQEIIQQLKGSGQGQGEPLLFIWGPNGHGKSHLLQACCQEAYQHNISAFFLDLTIGNNTSPGMLEGLENFELVCLDNIDAMIGDKNWEMACFHYFNRQREKNHALILSASRSPSTLNFSLNDLQTRVNWGLTLAIKPLDDAEKLTALQFKAQRMGFEIAPPAAQFLLTRYSRDLKALWLILDKLDHASLAAKRKITLPFLKEILDI